MKPRRSLVAVSLTHSDEEGAGFLPQAMSSGDDPALAENGAPTKQLTAGSPYQGHLGGGGAVNICRNTLQLLLFSLLYRVLVPAMGSPLGLPPRPLQCV